MDAKATTNCEIKDDGLTIDDILKDIKEKTGYEFDIEPNDNTRIDIYYEKDQPNKIFIRSNTVEEDPICRIKYPHSCSICDFNEITTVPSLPHEPVISNPIKI